MAKVICNFPIDSSFFDDLRCPYCRENHLDLPMPIPFHRFGLLAY